MACCKVLCDELSDKTDILLNLPTTSLIGFFGEKKNKLTWSGTLYDLKTFVSTIIDEKTAESAVWRHQAAVSGVSLAKILRLRGTRRVEQ